MDYKIEKITIGKDKKVEYYFQQAERDRMLIDREMAMALQWQLMKEKFEDAIDGMVPPQPIEWTYADVREAATTVFEELEKFY